MNLKRYAMKVFFFLFSLVSWIIQLFVSPKLVVERVQHRVPSLAYASQKELKVVLLTDFHYDPSYWPRCVQDSQLDDMLRLTNAEDPDLIFLTGDFVDRLSPPIVGLTSRWLAKLKAKYGVFAVMGNHDYKDGANGRGLILNSLTGAGIKVLNSEVVYPVDGDPFLEVVGLGDMYFRDFNLGVFEKATKDPRTTRLVLSHNPDSAALFQEWKVDLQFSGHTHADNQQEGRSGGLGQLCRCSQPWQQIHVLRHWEWAHGLHFVDRIDNGEEKGQVEEGEEEVDGGEREWGPILVTSPVNVVTNSTRIRRTQEKEVQPVAVTSCGTKEDLCLVGLGKEPAREEGLVREGWEEAGKNGLYVSRGLATHPPLRFLCSPEISVITLKAPTFDDKK